MNLIDALVPLLVGLLLVGRPQLVLKRTGADEEYAKKTGKIRKLGYVLVGVALVYLLIALVRR